MSSIQVGLGERVEIAAGVDERAGDQLGNVLSAASRHCDIPADSQMT